jgi:hypothetical protein
LPGAGKKPYGKAKQAGLNKKDKYFLHQRDNATSHKFPYRF